MKSCVTVLAILSLGLSANLAHACGNGDFNNPAVQARLAPLSDILKAALENAPPMKADGVTVRDMGQIVFRSTEPYYSNFNPLNYVKAEGILLSNGVKIDYDGGYVSSSYAFTPTLQIDVREAPALYDSYKRQTKAAHCVVEVSSHTSDSSISNSDNHMNFDSRIVLSSDDVKKITGVIDL